jgi:hypothetical protein
LIAETLGLAGPIADGLATVKQALAWSERTEGKRLIAELLRVKGELLLLQDGEGAAAAVFWQALDWARGAVRQPVYDRFTEGFDTADLKAARALLHGLRESGGSAQSGC